VVLNPLPRSLVEISQAESQPYELATARSSVLLAGSYITTGNSWQQDERKQNGAVHQAREDGP